MHYKDTYEKAEKAKAMLEAGTSKEDVKKEFHISTMTLWRWLNIVSTPVLKSQKKNKK